MFCILVYRCHHIQLSTADRSAKEKVKVRIDHADGSFHLVQVRTRNRSAWTSTCVPWFSIRDGWRGRTSSCICSSGRETPWTLLAPFFFQKKIEVALMKRRTLQAAIKHLAKCDRVPPCDECEKAKVIVAQADKKALEKMLDDLPPPEGDIVKRRL